MTNLLEETIEDIKSSGHDIGDRLYLAFGLPVTVLTDKDEVLNKP